LHSWSLHQQSNERKEQQRAMDGEKKLVLCVVGLIVLCVTVLYAFLFVSLWPYRTSVGLSLLGLMCFTVVLWRVVDARGKLNEQELRQRRYRHQEETPLDLQGEAQYWPQGAQANPHRRTVPYYYQPYRYEPYQEQGQER
jgi:hypothetical protein